MSEQQTYEDIDDMLIEPCKHCNVRCNDIQKYGREITSESDGGPAGSYSYYFCSNCNNLKYWTM